MRVSISPAGRMVRLETPSLRDAEHIDSAYGRSGVLTIERFLDFVDHEDAVLCPSPDLKPFLQRIIRDTEALGVRLSQLDALMPFQDEGVGFLWRNRGALLTDEQGLGKTIQALCAIEPGRQALVICPAFMREVWLDEARKWRADLNASVVAGKITRVPEPGELMIASYESLPPDPHRLATFFPSTALISDEASFLKNFTATRTKLFRALARLVRQSGFVWLLTGTPVINDPGELWALLQAAGIAHDAYPDGRDQFDRLWGGYRTVEGIVWGKPKIEALERLRPFYLRRNRLDVLPQLPGKIYTDIPVHISPAADERITMQTVLDDHAEEFALGDLDKLRSTNVSTARRILSRLKIPAAHAFAQRATAPLVVFSCFVDTVKSFAVLPGWRLIHGEVPDKVRHNAVKALQAGELRGLACTIATAGMGLTMTKSHDALFIDEAYTHAENIQAEDRLCRIGQNMTVQITRLVADHQLDRRVHQILKVKRELAAPMSWHNPSQRSIPLDRLREFVETMP